MKETNESKIQKLEARIRELEADKAQRDARITTLEKRHRMVLRVLGLPADSIDRLGAEMGW